MTNRGNDRRRGDLWSEQHGRLEALFEREGAHVSVHEARTEAAAPSLLGGQQAGQGGFADVPDNTRILGAAKVTGSLAPGWTLAAPAWLLLIAALPVPPPAVPFAQPVGGGLARWRSQRGRDALDD